MTRNNEILKEMIKLGWTTDGYRLFNPKGEEKYASINNRGYFSYHISINSRMSNVHLHRMVAYKKYGDKIFNKGIVVRHKDGNKLNNDEDNILIGTHTDNMRDIPIQIRKRSAITASNKIRKFTDIEVQEIKKDRELGMTYKQLCEKWKSPKSTFSYIFHHALYAKKPMEEI